MIRVNHVCDFIHSALSLTPEVQSFSEMFNEQLRKLLFDIDYLLLRNTVSFRSLDLKEIQMPQVRAHTLKTTMGISLFGSATEHIMNS